MNRKIAVAGTGYVGLSLATLLAQHNQVIAVDVISEKVDKINHSISPIQDEYIEKYLREKSTSLPPWMAEQPTAMPISLLLQPQPTTIARRISSTPVM